MLDEESKKDFEIPLIQRTFQTGFESGEVTGFMSGFFGWS